MAIAARDRAENQKAIDELSGIEKIKYDISILKGRLLDYECDLKGMLKGNTMIMNKVKIMKEDMNKKIEELKKLEGEQTNVTSGN